MATPPDDVCAEAVYRRLFEELAPAIYRFFYYRSGEESVAGDLVQEAFLKLWENCKKVSPENARAYLYTVARNKQYKLHARKQVARKYAALLPAAEATAPDDPQSLLEEAEFAERLREALTGLTPACREVFLLNRVEGLKYREIADRLDISQKAVEKRMHKALLELRQLHPDL
jgi:RNA polymerase sigma-70 factor (ECF subfamily)